MIIGIISIICGVLVLILNVVFNKKKEKEKNIFRRIVFIVSNLLIIFGTGFLVFTIFNEQTGNCCTCLDCLSCDVCCDCQNPYLNK